MPQVDVVHLLPRLRRGLAEGHQRPVVADVVHQHIDPPVFGEYCLGQLGDIVVEGDVDDMSPDASARAGHLVANPVCAIPIDFCDLDGSAVLGEKAGDPRADAVAATGDNGHLSVEQPIPVVDCRDPVVVAGHGDGPYPACGRIA